MTQVAADFLQAALHANSGDRAPLTALLTVTVDGEAKPLLLIGNAHPCHDDGYVVAVLNPDPALVDEFRPGVGYSKWSVREMACNRADMALLIWVIGNDESSRSVTRCYTANSPKPAQFCVA